MTDVRSDLEMQVRTASEHGKTQLIYTLHSPTGVVNFAHREIVGPTFKGSPEEFQGRLLHRMEQFGEWLDIDGTGLLAEDLDRKLAALGRDLWRQLLPAEIHHAYREIRRSVRSWMIISDEPWIPWELIKPYDDGSPGELVDDDFISLRFELTRWLAGHRTPVQEFRVSHRAAFRTATDLPQSKHEIDLMTDLAGPLQGVADVSPRVESAADLLAFLEEAEVEWLHFAGHGTYVAAQPEDSGIPFPDGSVLRPGDFVGPVATRLSRCRPLVFLNACWTGQQGWSLTRLGGWSSRWILECGCGALIAPMWPVRDKVALIFARTFYDALVNGETLGRAALAARQQVYKERPGDPSALAYAVYGHPHARLGLGGSLTTEQAATETEASRRRRIRARRFRPRPRSRWIWPAVAACGAAVALNFAATPLLNLLLPATDPPVQQQGFVPIKRPVSKEKQEPTPPKKPATGKPAGTSTTVGGLRFEIAGAQANLHYALKQALQRAASPVSEEGISGWTLTLRLDQPRIDQHAQEGFAMVACRLTAEASARGPDSSIDLGLIDAVSSQFDSTQACESAAGLLAERVLTRFVADLGALKGAGG